MTLFMLAAQRTLTHRQQYALPPEILTDTFARLVGLRKHMKKPHLLLASFVSHLSFGAAAGAIYGPLTRIIPIPSVPKRDRFWSRGMGGKLSGMDPSRRNGRSGYQTADPAECTHGCCPCRVGSRNGSAGKRVRAQGRSASVSRKVQTREPASTSTLFGRFLTKGRRKLLPFVNQQDS